MSTAKAAARRGGGAATAVLDVTAVIPAFNRADLIGRAVLSAVVQTPVPAAEVIVVDDGSTDGTGEVAAALGARVVRQDNGGEGAARNAGLRAATTTWVAFLDSDDLWLENHLAVLAPHLREPLTVIGTGGRAIPTGRRLGRVGTQPTPLTSREAVWPSAPILPSAVVVHRETALAVGGFRSMRRSADLDFWLRLLAVGPGLVIPQVTALYLEHVGQISGDRGAMRASRTAVLADFRGAGWCDEALLRRIRVQDDWDRLRELQREGQWRAALGVGAGIVTIRGALPAMRDVLASRRLSRRG